MSVRHVRFFASLSNTPVGNRAVKLRFFDMGQNEEVFMQSDDQFHCHHYGMSGDSVGCCIAADFDNDLVANPSGIPNLYALTTSDPFAKQVLANITALQIPNVLFSPHSSDNNSPIFCSARGIAPVLATTGGIGVLQCWGTGTIRKS